MPSGSAKTREGCVINSTIEPMLISIKRLKKEAGRKAYNANFKYMHIADSRHKGRRKRFNK